MTLSKSTTDALNARLREANGDTGSVVDYAGDASQLEAVKAKLEAAGWVFRMWEDAIDGKTLTADLTKAKYVAAEHVEILHKTRPAARQAQAEANGEVTKGDDTYNVPYKKTTNGSVGMFMSNPTSKDREEITAAEEVLMAVFDHALRR